MSTSDAWDRTENSISNPSGNAVAKVSSLRNISTIKSVTEPAQIEQVARLRRVRLNLPPQINDVVIDDPLRRKRIWRPSAGEQALAAEHPPARFDKQRQQFKFKRRELHRLAALTHLAADKINLDFPETISLGILLPGAPAQQSLNASAQFPSPERFGDVIVRAQFERHDFLRLQRLRGQHQNRGL